MARCVQISDIETQNIQDNSSFSDSSNSDGHSGDETEVTVAVCGRCYNKVNSQAIEQQIIHYVEITTEETKTVTLRSNSSPQNTVNASTKKYFYGNHTITTSPSEKRKRAEQMSKVFTVLRFFETKKEMGEQEATTTNQNMCSDLTGFYHISIDVLKDVSEMKACLNQLHPLMASLPEKIDANTRKLKKKLEHPRKLRRSSKKWSEQVAQWCARLEADFKEISVNDAATKEEINSLKSDIAEVNRNNQLQASKIDTLNKNYELLLNAWSTVCRYLAENETSNEEATTSNQELSEVKAWMDEISPTIVSLSKNEQISGELTEIKKELSELREGFDEQIDNLKEVKNLVQSSVYKKLSEDLEEKPQQESPTENDTIANRKAIDKKSERVRVANVTLAECKVYACSETVDEFFANIRKYHSDYTDFSHAQYIFRFIKGKSVEAGLKKLYKRFRFMQFSHPSYE